jgi:hypothetical protein
MGLGLGFSVFAEASSKIPQWDGTTSNTIHLVSTWTMGIHKLLPNLPGGNTATDTKYGLQKLNVEEHTIALDAGTLLFECAQRRPTSYLTLTFLPCKFFEIPLFI